jgi:RNA polymerase sigma-70 factor (ECF subfamily)
MTNKSEEHLVGRAQNGDLDAFEELVRQHQERVYAIACQMVGDRDDARDVCQERFPLEEVAQILHYYYWPR